MDDLISRQAAIDLIECMKPYHQTSDDIAEMIHNMPSARPEADKIYGIMKDYYFEHKDEHDQSWQGGFAKCMNLIPNVWERREDGSD